MKVKTETPFGLDSREHFVCMGLVHDSGKDYACLLDIAEAKKTMEASKKASTIRVVSTCCYVEEIHWDRTHNFALSTLHQIDNDEEWARVTQFVMNKTTIFSPKKIKNILKHGVYFYASNYFTKEETRKDAEHRAKEGIL